MRISRSSLFFFFNDTATTEIYTLSLHDALPIFQPVERRALYLALPPKLLQQKGGTRDARPQRQARPSSRLYPDLRDRKSTRLNSSHANISYAVFCLKKKKKMSKHKTHIQERQNI